MSKLPYIDLAVYVISEWKKIGVEAEHKVEESATWSKSRVARDFEVLIDPYGSATVGDPDEMLDKFVTGASENWGRFSDPVVDKLYEQQAREMDAQKRIATGEADGQTHLREGLAHPGAVELTTGGTLGQDPQLYAAAQPLDESPL